jgi:hypothetical protein
MILLEVSAQGPRAICSSVDSDEAVLTSGWAILKKIPDVHDLLNLSYSIVIPPNAFDDPNPSMEA